ncbi:uncharacterized protein P884DRAFT_199871, partial [Thermothelomyces heterothallicus CBS 202.75]|uniref:uncharacterized protein n=1 Tax=Thermothelomyces heterothallicus CBS 202.75 TaxID=1149848 RepID=UPI003743DC26
ICLEPFRDQSLVRALPCHHLFHAECIARWFRKHHDTCPICMARDDSVSGSGGRALPEQPAPAFLAF